MRNIPQYLTETERDSSRRLQAPLTVLPVWYTFSNVHDMIPEVLERSAIEVGLDCVSPSAADLSSMEPLSCSLTLPYQSIARPPFWAPGVPVEPQMVGSRDLRRMWARQEDKWVACPCIFQRKKKVWWAITTAPILIWYWAPYSQYTPLETLLLSWGDSLWASSWGDVCCGCDVLMNDQ